MITSTGNPKIKNVLLLQSKSKARREQDAFITEGIRMFLEAPIDRIREVYISESFSVSEAAAKKTNAASPKTGDSLPVIPLAVLMITSLAGALLLKKKRTNI